MAAWSVPPTGRILSGPACPAALLPQLERLMKQHDASSADELLEMAEKQASGRSLQLAGGTCCAVPHIWHWPLPLCAVANCCHVQAWHACPAVARTGQLENREPKAAACL